MVVTDWYFHSAYLYFICETHLLIEHRRFSVFCVYLSWFILLSLVAPRNAHQESLTMKKRKSLPNDLSAKYLVATYEVAARSSKDVLEKFQLCVRHPHQQHKVFANIHHGTQYLYTLVAIVPCTTTTECNIFRETQA